MTKKVDNKMVKFSGLMPANLKRDLERLAKAEAMTFSQLFRTACIKYLKEAENR